MLSVLKDDKREFFSAFFETLLAMSGRDDITEEDKALLKWQAKYSGLGHLTEDELVTAAFMAKQGVERNEPLEPFESNYLTEYLVLMEMEESQLSRRSH